MAVEIGEEWDPGAHDYGQYTTDDGRLLGQMMALGALSAFALIGVGAFCAYAAAELDTALTITYTVGGTSTFAGGTALTETQAALIDFATTTDFLEGGVLGAGGQALNMLIDTWGLSSFTAEGLIALAAYQPSPLDAANYGYFGGYLGNFGFGNGLPGGGLTTPPGFPGFPGFGYPVWDPFAGAGHFFCVKINDDYMCHWEY